MPFSRSYLPHGRAKVRAGAGSSVSSLALDGNTLELNQTNSEPQRTVDLSSIGVGDIGGTVSTNYIPYASSDDTLANFALAYTEGANIIMGNKPDSMTSDADSNTGFGYNVFNKYTTADNSTAFGAYALVEASGANVYRNTALGMGASQY